MRILPLLSLAACAAPAAPVAEQQQQRAPAIPSPQPLRSDFVLEGQVAQGSIVRGRAPSGTIRLALDGKPVALAEDGRFLLGFDRDQPGDATLAATLENGRVVSRPLRVQARPWNIQHIDVAKQPSMPAADYLRRRKAELARIGAARAVNADSEGWRQQFIWPATGRISGVFGSQRVYRGEPGSYHSGVDIAPGAGTPVKAPADGVVVLAGPPAFSLEGNLVIIDHGMGLNSAFLHLAETRVREGETVRQGQVIGTVGATGRATGPHLHWSMKWGAARIDPQALAGAMRGTH